MTVEEAKNKVEESTGLNVERIADCGDKWVFSFKEFNNKEDDSEDELIRLLNRKSGSFAAFIRKNVGEVEYCSTYEAIIMTKH